MSKSKKKKEKQRKITNKKNHICRMKHTHVVFFFANRIKVLKEIEGENWKICTMWFEFYFHCRCFPFNIIFACLERRQIKEMCRKTRINAHISFCFQLTAIRKRNQQKKISWFYTVFNVSICVIYLNKNKVNEWAEAMSSTRQTKKKTANVKFHICLMCVRIEFFSSHFWVLESERVRMDLNIW